MRAILVQPPLRLAATAAETFSEIHALLAAARVDFRGDDIVLLPEGVDRSGAPAAYEREVCALARAIGCHIVGGSHREPVAAGAVNAGVVCDPDGTVIGRYEKLRPYAQERRVVHAGSQLGEFVIGGHNVLVLICADFWFADLIQRAARLPDLILVAALSVTRKPTPDCARALWRHLAVARAYEFGTYIAISDWSPAAATQRPLAAGVGGFADPTATNPERLFSPIGSRGVAVQALNFAALHAFRQDRSDRGFFWKPLESAPPS